MLVVKRVHVERGRAFVGAARLVRASSWRSGRRAGRGSRRALLLCALVGLCAARGVARAATHDPSAFDADKLLTPEDADTLGLEDSIVAGRREDDARRPLKLSPMAMVMFIAPIEGGPPMLNGMLQVDATLRRGAFGAQFTPRLRLGDAFHPLAETTVFLQQAFVFFRAAAGEVKLGKVIGQFGRVWDYGLWGPLIAAYDVKVTPDVGASFELSQPLLPKLELEVVGQYFPVDGRTFSVRNASLFSVARARHRHVAGVRVVPVLRLGESRLRLGLSGQHFTSQRPHPHQVWRTAVDVDFDHPRLGAFAEVGRQDGGDVPSQDESVGSFSYLWTGTELRMKPISVRYHFNIVRYEAPEPRVDMLHQGGAEWTASDSVSVVLEAAYRRGDSSIFTAFFFKL